MKARCLHGTSLVVSDGRYLSEESKAHIGANDDIIGKEVAVPALIAS